VSRGSRRRRPRSLPNRARCRQTRTIPPNEDDVAKRGRRRQTRTTPPNEDDPAKRGPLRPNHPRLATMSFVGDNARDAPPHEARHVQPRIEPPTATAHETCTWGVGTSPTEDHVAKRGRRHQKRTTPAETSSFGDNVLRWRQPYELARLSHAHHRHTADVHPPHRTGTRHDHAGAAHKRSARPPNPSPHRPAPPRAATSPGNSKTPLARGFAGPGLSSGRSKRAVP
jgi:hypothetical protein